MAYVLDLRGFETRDPDSDGLTVTAGAPAYETADLPPGSQSGTAIGGPGAGFTIPWAAAPSGSALWFGFRLRTRYGDENDSLVVGVGAAAGESFTLTGDADTDSVALAVAGSVVAVTDDPWASGTWETLHVHVGGLTVGTVVSVYRDGDLERPVIAYALTTDDAAALATRAPDRWHVRLKTDGDDLIDDLFALDPAGAGFPGITHFSAASVAPVPLTGAGPEADWDGDVADLDETPFVAPGITTETIGAEASFTKDPIAVDNVFAFRVVAGVTRAGLTAGANLTIGAVTGADADEAATAAPEAGTVARLIEAAPDGSTLTPSRFDALRILFRTES